ncbi:MAG: TonB family protein, partial [Myxococcales bacterium]|nr:TonB family protein [Myxococcales bacterium]
IQFVEAIYPATEQEQGVESSVLLEIVIASDGTVAEVAIVESGGESFDQAAIEAARQFLFSPAEVDGVPAPIRIRYQYDFALAEQVIEIPASQFGGRVLNVDTGEPVEGITVSIGTQSTTTAVDGTFEFADVEPGELQISLEGDGLAPLFGTELLGEGERLDVTYEVSVLATAPSEEGILLEIVVTAPRARSEAIATTIDAGQARSVPGTSGDVVRVVENMPGVARAGAGQGNLVVWGASPEDTRVYLDGVPLPRLYHESGVRAVVHPEFVKAVSLIPGGWGAAYGRGLGGIVVVDTQAPDETGVHGTIGVDIYDASAAITHRADSGFTAGASARYGLIKPLGTAVSPEAGDFLSLPRYWDGQARAGYEFLNGQDLQFVVIASGDVVTRRVANEDPALETSEDRDLSFGRFYIRYEDDQGARGRTLVTPWIGIDSRARSSRYGSIVTSESSEGISGGLRASRTTQPAPFLEVEYGMDAEVVRATNERQGSLALPPREGDARVFGQPPPDQLSQDEWRTTSVGIAPYLELRAALFDERLRVTPGLRFDPHARSVSRRIPVSATVPDVGLYRADFALEPRLAVEGEPVSWLTLRAATGIYHQYPGAGDVSPVFGNPDLEIASGRHWLAGVALRTPVQLTLELTGFLSQTSDLAVRVNSATPAIAEALTTSGEGRARGVQVLVRREMANGLFGWIAYTWSVAERRNASSEAWRLFDFDQTHVLTAVAGWQPGRGWDISARFRYATGTPRTEVTGALSDLTRDRYEPVFGDVNGIRLPAFLQLDLRVAKTFGFASGDLQAFFELLNATNRQNAEEFVYNSDFSERANISGLPILPMVGLQWTF